MLETIIGWTGLILGFSGLIFIHELGHFSLAKWNGVRVYVFSLGMGPYLVSFTYKGTLYALSMIPIGGYVKLMGQDDLNPNEDATPDPHDYRNKRPGQKAAILAAGAAFNIALTLIIFTFCYYHGMDMKAATIGKLAPDSKLATKATIKGPKGEDIPTNLQEGEKILAVNGVPVKSFFEAMLQVSGVPSGSKIILDVEGPNRHPPDNTVSVIVNYDKKLGATGIGLTPYVQQQRYYLGFTTKDTVAVAGFGDPKDPSAAKDAGVKEKDIILRINGKTVNDEEEFILDVQSCGGKNVTLDVSREIERDGEHVQQELTIPITPKFIEKVGTWRIGLAPNLVRQVIDIDPASQAYKAGLRKADYVTGFQPTDEHWAASRRMYSRGTLGWRKDPFDLKDVQHAELTNLTMDGEGLSIVQKHEDTYFYHAEGGFWDAVGVSWTDTMHFGGSVFTVIRGMFSGDVSGKNASGPVGIGHYIFKVASRQSFIEFLWFMGFISLNLGVLQFMPIPILDGWHLLMVLVEKLKGSPVSPKVLEISQVVGIVIVGTLLVYVTYNDIARFFA